MVYQECGVVPGIGHGEAMDSASISLSILNGEIFLILDHFAGETSQISISELGSAPSYDYIQQCLLDYLTSPIIFVENELTATERNELSELIGSICSVKSLDLIVIYSFDLNLT